MNIYWILNEFANILLGEIFAMVQKKEKNWNYYKIAKINILLVLLILLWFESWLVQIFAWLIILKFSQTPTSRSPTTTFHNYRESFHRVQPLLEAIVSWPLNWIQETGLSSYPKFLTESLQEPFWQSWISPSWSCAPWLVCSAQNPLEKTKQSRVDLPRYSSVKSVCPIIQCIKGFNWKNVNVFSVKR